MPQMKQAKDGEFCWVELQTTDVAAAKKFYGEVFGWKYEDMPMPQGSYALAKRGDALTAGLMVLPEAAANTGTPPNWSSYVKVSDVAKSTADAARLGGKVLLGPTPMGAGTFSVLADPTGGVLCLWTTTQSMGSFLVREPGGLSWNELLSTNVDVAQRFYTQLFGWTTEPMPMNHGTYLVLKVGAASIGGMMAQPKEAQGAPSAWVPYFEVADADATSAAATKIGGKVLVPLMDVPNVGRFGWLQDPQGATFAIVKSAM